MAAEDSTREETIKALQDDTMAVQKVTFGPAVVKSEPNTPIYATVPTTEEAPNHWFAPINYREHLAVMTMEHIPFIIREAIKDHTKTDTTQLFSPRLLPLLDRMKIHFARAMSLARHEAANGVFNMRGVPGSTYRNPEPILECDVMSSLHVEAFLAGIEEIKLSEESERVVYRRYWRILEPPGNHNATLGGVVSSGSNMEHHNKEKVSNFVQEFWHETPKMLIAEFAIGSDGCPVSGRLLHYHE